MVFVPLTAEYDMTIRRITRRDVYTRAFFFYAFFTHRTDRGRATTEVD